VPGAAVELGQLGVGAVDLVELRRQRQVAHERVRPGMVAQLVAGVDQALDQGALAVDAIADQEEAGRGAVALQQLQDRRREIGVRAVVEGQVEEPSSKVR